MPARRPVKTTAKGAGGLATTHPGRPIRGSARREHAKSGQVGRVRRRMHVLPPDAASTPGGAADAHLASASALSAFSRARSWDSWHSWNVALSGCSVSETPTTGTSAAAARRLMLVVVAVSVWTL